MNHPERDLHFEVADWLSWALAPPALWFHIPNGGSRGSWLEGKNLKRMGTRAGMLDLGFLFTGRAWFLELKADDGGLSDSQEHMIPLIERAGCPTAVCRSRDEVEVQLRAWRLPILDEKPATTALSAGFTRPADFPPSDAIGRRKRLAQPLDFR